MIERLIHALVQSKNEAADDVLLEALRLGAEPEKLTVLRALLLRQTVHGLAGVIEQYDLLSEVLQSEVLRNIRILHHALRECGRSKRTELRLGALKLIALGRQGKLAYVLSENLHESDETLSKAATEALVALARWISTETRRLAASAEPPSPETTSTVLTTSRAQALAGASLGQPEEPSQAARIYHELLEQRPEIEAAVARAIDVHRGRHGQDLLRAALLLCDWAGSKTLAILHTAKHGGQGPMVRRLQQPPAGEHVEAFLLAASHGQLRSHFAVAFSHIDNGPVLDALLRKTHWLKDHQLLLCMHQVNRGAWWAVGDLVRDADRRTPEEASRIAEWIGVSGASDVVQDERMEKLLRHAAPSFEGRLRLLRIAARRKRGSSVRLLTSLLADPDERIARMAAREIVRRRPPNHENLLLGQMAKAPQSVRRVIGRVIGQAGFEQYWQRFDRLDLITRGQAGRAMLKILPDAAQRLQRRLGGGAIEQRMKAMQITHELGLAERMRPTLLQLVGDPHPRLRSRAVIAVGDVDPVPAELLVDRLVNDTDARVRANAIDVLERSPRAELLPVLMQLVLSPHNRERASAIKALHRIQVGPAVGQLVIMLRDDRSDHRISAMWALKQIGWWKLLDEVGRLAREDTNIQVRRYAISVLRSVSEMARQQNHRREAV